MIFEGVRRLVHGVDVVAHEPVAREIAGKAIRVIGRGFDGAVMGLIFGLAMGYMIVKRGERKQQFADHFLAAVCTIGLSVALSTIAGVGYELRK